MNACKSFFYPETAAGGFSHVDGTVAFYARINALMQPDMTVLDYGAGRGKGVQDDQVSYRRGLRDLKGKCKRLIGVDVDEAIHENPGLDEAHVIPPGGAIPLPTASVDLIVSDNTFEHITDPGPVARELDRVLKPGGWICARTPNRWGYIALGASLVPNALHVAFLRRLQPDRKAVDVFPTAYKLNTREALRRHFPNTAYEHCSYTHFAEPAYFANSRVLWALMLLVFRLTPPALAPTRMIFLRKRDSH